MICSVYITCANRTQARTIARTLLEERLIACANLLPVESLFWWKGSVQEEAEVAIIAKTSQEKFSAVEKRVKELHTNTVPCVVAWPIVEASPEYSLWVTGEVISRDDQHID